MGTQFQRNELIISLADILNMENVTALGSSVFGWLSSLVVAAVPPRVTALPHGCFQYCTAISEIIVPEGVTDFSYRWNFGYCDNLEVLVWPSSLLRITMETARNCPKLQCVICKSTNATGYNTSNGSMFTRSSNAVIYVPDESVEMYKATSGWSTYASKIKGKSELPDEYKKYWP